MIRTTLLGIILSVLFAASAVAQGDLPLLLSTAAGDGYSINGDGRYAGDDGPATLGSLRYPTGIYLDDAGWLYISDRHNNRIRSVSPSGIIQTAMVLGNLRDPLSGAVLEPTGQTKDRNGNIYVTDNVNNRVRSLTPSGEVGVIAGSIQWVGGDPFYGDNGPATEASLYGPSNVVIDNQDIVYIADTFNNRIRRVTPGGFLSTYAGSAERGYAGDGGVASDAWLNNPTDIHIGPDGLYIADRLNNRIRRVDSKGIITTVAGNGQYGYNGDGQPATEASLRAPEGIFVDEAGNLYIADTASHRIRKVDVNGVISTVAGSGTRGHSEDGVRASEAKLNHPSDVAFTGTTLLISDTRNHQVRAATPMQFWLSVTLDRDRVRVGETISVDIRLRTLDGTADIPGNINVALGIASGPGEVSADSVKAVDGFASATLTTTGLGSIVFWAHSPGGERRTLDILTFTELSPADFTGDGHVDFQDFLQFAAAFGSAQGSPTFDAKFDLTSDNRIDFQDFLILAAAFGK